MDKTKKRPLVIPLPSNITGVTAVLKAHAKADIREIESNVDMQVGDRPARIPGYVCTQLGKFGAVIIRRSDWRWYRAANMHVWFPRRVSIG